MATRLTTPIIQKGKREGHSNNNTHIITYRWGVRSRRERTEREAKVNETHTKTKVLAVAPERTPNAHVFASTHRQHRDRQNRKGEIERQARRDRQRETERLQSSVTLCFCASECWVFCLCFYSSTSPFASGSVPGCCSRGSFQLVRVRVREREREKRNSVSGEIRCASSEWFWLCYCFCSWVLWCCGSCHFAN